MNETQIPGADAFIARLAKATGDVWRQFDAPNGWGLSVIRTQGVLVEVPGREPQRAGGSYGWGAGLFEVALLDRDDEVTFDGPLLEEPKGFLTADEVAVWLRAVFELPPAP